MLTVACVYRTGGEYSRRSVVDLLASVAPQLARTPHRVVCLTDSDEDLGCERVPLQHGWPGWWSKIELFRPGALPDGPKFYLDLDTVAVRPMDDIVLGHTFTVLTNFWSDERIGSGLMAWSVDLSALYAKFAADPQRHMDECVTTERWGDQGFIRFNSPVQPQRWQTLHPGRVVSFKRHCVPAAKIPREASIVCFHGRPRPWQLNTFQRRWFINARPVSKIVALARA